MEELAKYKVPKIDYLHEAKKIIIYDTESYVKAGEFLKGLLKAKKMIEAYFKPIKQSAYQSYKEILAKEKEELKQLVEAEQTVRRLINKFLEEQEQIRIETQKQAEEDAKKKAEELRQNLLKQAELETDEKKKEELKLQAELVYAQPVTVNSAIEIVKTSNATLSAKKDIEIEIVNIKEFLRRVIDGVIPSEMVKIDKAALKRWIKENNMDSVTGIKITYTRKVTVR